MRIVIIPLIRHLNLEFLRQKFEYRKLRGINNNFYWNTLHVLSLSDLFAFWPFYNTLRQRVLPCNTVQCNKIVFVLSLQSCYCNYALWKVGKWPFPVSSLDPRSSLYHPLLLYLLGDEMNRICKEFKTWEPFSYIWAKNIFSLVLNSFPKKFFFIIAEHNIEVFRELATIITELLPGIISLNLEPECTGYALFRLSFPDALFHLFFF